MCYQRTEEGEALKSIAVGSLVHLRDSHPLIDAVARLKDHCNNEWLLYVPCKWDGILYMWTDQITHVCTHVHTLVTFMSTLAESRNRSWLCFAERRKMVWNMHAYRCAVMFRIIHKRSCSENHCTPGSQVAGLGRVAHVHPWHTYLDSYDRKDIEEHLQVSWLSYIDRDSQVVLSIIILAVMPCSSLRLTSDMYHGAEPEWVHTHRPKHETLKPTPIFERHIRSQIIHPVGDSQLSIHRGLVTLTLWHVRNWPRTSSSQTWPWRRLWMDLLQRMDGLRIINSVMVHILLLIKSCIVLPQFPNLYWTLCRYN